MIWLDVGYNGSEGFTTTRVGFDRVPTEGERMEFRDPEGGESPWPPDLDGNVFYVAQVNWVAPGPGRGAKPMIVLESPRDLLADLAHQGRN